MRCCRHIRKPAEDVLVIIGTRRYRVGAHHLRRYVDDARRALGDGLRWSTARDRLRMQVAEDVRRQREDVGGAPTDAETAKMSRSPAIKQFVDEVWPALTAPALLMRLWDDRDFLARCAPTLTAQERDALHRPARASARTVRWSAADTVLLDELTGMIDGAPTYVHVVVDEAQDLSAMQCRAVARRCPLGSVTVLGDLAQATTPVGTRRLGGHPAPSGSRVRGGPSAHRGLPGARRGHRAGEPVAAAHRGRRAAGHRGARRASRRCGSRRRGR